MGTKADIHAGNEPCFTAASMNEPLFILRSTDPDAPSVIREWARLYFATRIADRQLPLGASEEEAALFEQEQSRRLAKYTEALLCARKMEAYRAAYMADHTLPELERIAAAEAAAGAQT